MSIVWYYLDTTASILATSLGAANIRDVSIRYYNRESNE